MTWAAGVDPFTYRILRTRLRAPPNPQIPTPNATIVFSDAMSDPNPPPDSSHLAPGVHLPGQASVGDVPGAGSGGGGGERGDPGGGGVAEPDEGGGEDGEDGGLDMVAVDAPDAAEYGAVALVPSPGTNQLMLSFQGEVYVFHSVTPEKVSESFRGLYSEFGIVAGNVWKSDGDMWVISFYCYGHS